MSDPMSDSKFREMRDTARSIFLKSLAEASVAKGFAKHVHCERGILRVCEDLYDLHSYSTVLVLSMGKAGHTMVEALRDRVGDSLEGIVASSVQPRRKCGDSDIFAEDIPRPMKNPSKPLVRCCGLSTHKRLHRS